MAKIEQTLSVNTVSRISVDTFFTGNISSPYDLRIDGNFKGKLFSNGRVVIGETATVEGEIVCSNVDLWGKMKGDLYVKDTLSLKNGCSVEGTLTVRKLFVEIGSVFNGTCRMISEKEYEDVVSKMDQVKPAETKRNSAGQNPDNR